MLPSCLSKGRFSHNLEFPETSVSQSLKIIGLGDSVEGRINVTVNNGQVTWLVCLLFLSLLDFICLFFKVKLPAIPFDLARTLIYCQYFL